MWPSLWLKQVANILTSTCVPAHLLTRRNLWQLNRPRNARRIKSNKETGAEIVLIAVQRVRAGPRKPAITQIPRDRSWVPQAAPAPFPRAPPTPLCRHAGPTSASDLAQTQQPPLAPSVTGFSYKERKLPTHFRGVKAGKYSSTLCNIPILVHFCLKLNLHFKFGLGFFFFFFNPKYKEKHRQF